MQRGGNAVRRAVASDLTDMIAADHVAQTGDGNRLNFLTSALGAGWCLVFIDAEGLGGFAVTRPRHFFGRDFVDLLMVHPVRRRSGIGRCLLRSAVASANTSTVFTSTNQSNAAMRGLLLREGWTVSGTLVGLDDNDPEMVFWTERQ